jgi:hypothetical protein
MLPSISSIRKFDTGKCHHLGCMGWQKSGLLALQYLYRCPTGFATIEVTQYPGSNFNKPFPNDRSELIKPCRLP